MRILIYGINFAPELVGVGKYTGEMADYLAARGHQVRVVAAPPYYPDWRIFNGYSRWRYQRSKRGAISVWRCPLYVPARPGKLSRLLHLLSFAVSSAPIALAQAAWKPELVITLAPTLFTAPVALLAARLAGAKALLHIQDYEIEAMIGFGIGRIGVLSRLAFHWEKWLIKRFDRVSTISRSMAAIALEKGVAESKLFLFPNWVDTEVLVPGADGREYRQFFGLAANARVILHSGNIGKKQGLEMVLQAACHYAGHRPEIVFVIVGDGVEKANLQQQVRHMGLTNVIFGEFQPPERLASMLAMADIHLVLQRGGGGDAVFPSRLTALLSVGGNILVSCRAGTELHKLVQARPGIYRCIEPDDGAAFIETLGAVLQEQPTTFNTVARGYALENLSRQQILGAFERQLKALVGGGAPGQDSDCGSHESRY